MNKLLNRIRYKNIQELYQIKDISMLDEVVLKQKSICIYKVEPANIVACDEETKFKIYQAYVSCIRGLPNVFQIIVSKKQRSFLEQIKEYKLRLSRIKNDGLKEALKRYIEYLEEVSKITRLQESTCYLIVENVDSYSSKQIESVFMNLKEFGVVINKVVSKEEIQKVLRECITKKGN